MSKDTIQFSIKKVKKVRKNKTKKCRQNTIQTVEAWQYVPR